MTEEIIKKKRKSKLIKIFKRKRDHDSEKLNNEKEKKKTKTIGKRITGFFRKLHNRRNVVEDETILVAEEEIEINNIPDLLKSKNQEKADKKAAKKQKRKKRMKRVRRVVLRSCHYIGLGVVGMSPGIVYHSPMVGSNTFNYNNYYDYRNYQSSRSVAHWTSGIALANW